MSLETPEKIRSLQRKLYCKAKAEPAAKLVAAVPAKTKAAAEPKAKAAADTKAKAKAKAPAAPSKSKDVKARQ